MKQILTYSSNLLQGRNNFLLILLLAITSLVLPSTANAQGWFWDGNNDPTSGSQWRERNNGSFSSSNLATLSDGTTIWRGGQNLDTRPPGSFAATTTVNLRWRLTGNNNNGQWDAGFWINFIPMPNGSMGLVYVYLTSNGTNQTVNLVTKSSVSGGFVSLISSTINGAVTGMGFIDTRLVFNTSGTSPTIDLFINGTASGSGGFYHNIGANSDNFATILGSTSLMELDYICINNASCDVSAIYRGGSGSGSAVTGVTSFFALPVSLIDFKAAASKQNPKACLLEWQTSSESNSSHFDIEWSPSGAEWIKVGKVNTIGNSSTLQSYQFLHNETSVLNYYRLRHYDTDGSESLSDIRVVSLQSQVITPDINIYPNPSNSSIFVNTTFDSDISFEVSNNQGQVIQSGLFNKHLSLMNLTPGMYYLKLVSDNFTSTRKLIVSF